VIDVTREAAGAKFFLLADAPPDLAELEQAAQRYEQKRAQDRARLQAMLRYAESHLCRTRLLLSYFGYTDEGSEDCGYCDNCRAKRDGSRVDDTAAALAALREHRRLQSEPSPDGAGSTQAEDTRRALVQQLAARRRARMGRLRPLKIERARQVVSSTGFDKGDLVRHKKWGDGEVVRIAGDTVGAFFPGFGEKLLKASFLEKIEP